MISTRGDVCGWWLAVVLAAAGCADRTGVLLEVTRDEATVPADLDRLRFFVGVELEASFIDDGDPAAEVGIEDGRDLLGDPYLFLLSRGDMAEGAQLMAVVVAFQGDQVAGIGAVPGPLQFLDGKVTKYPVMLQGTAGGSVTITDTGCLIWTNGDGQVVISSKTDVDCDGDPKDTDCDDSNPNVGHTSPEVCENGIDDDCDDLEDEVEDADTDGVNNCDDCDDTNGDRFPGNLEVCDGLDNDCNQVCDDGRLDSDEDTYTECASKILEDGTCSDVNEALNDCNDDDPNIHPMAAEICDGIDNDCNEVCDDGFDEDGDLFTECGSRTDVCNGISLEDVDCEPDKPHANPGVLAESCDDADNTCDGVLYPDSVPCYVKQNDGQGDACKVGTRACDDGGAGWVADCVPDTTNNTEVPMPLCDAYAACQDTPDPWACANQMAAPTAHACTIFFPVATPGEICKPAAATLPHSPVSADPACEWFMAPARNRVHYDAVLSTDPQGTVGSQTSTTCQPLFVVRDTLVVPQLPDSWILVQNQDGATAQIFRINLTPQGVTSCPPNGLSCPAALPPPG